MNTSIISRIRTSSLLAVVAVLCAALGMSGCHYAATEIVLRVETDMDQGPGRVLTDVRVEVLSRGETAPRYSVTKRLAGTADLPLLPADLGITPLNNDGTRVITIRVTAIHDGADMFTYVATVPFEQGHTTTLSVFLADRCRDPAARRICVPDMTTCGREGCDDIQHMSLPLFNPDASNTDASDIVSDRGSDVPASEASIDAQADTMSCAMGSVRCGTACTAIQTDPHNCGACGNDCASRTGVDPASAHCTAGVCGFTCLAGQADCDSNPANGCETDTTAPANCGACGTVCMAGDVCGMRGGAYSCGSSCVAPTPTRCGFVCVDTASDPQHCGSCAMACAPVANGTSTCAMGTCGFRCNPGFHACAGRCVSDNAVASCGASCTPCTAPAHATSTCSGGVCGYLCMNDWGDCDALAANGCETDLRTATDCGGCMMSCPAAAPQCLPSGTSYACAAMCTPGAACRPARECSRGTISCPGGAANCDDVGDLAPGTPCGSTGVCSPTAMCVRCVAGEACTTGNPCENGQRVCSTGVPTCARSSFLGAGMACPGGVCNGSGTCVPCVAGTTCTRPNPCETGQINCASGGPVCDYLGPQPMGTTCGAGHCDGAGNCSTCMAGLSCSPSECRTGMTTCPTGCVPNGNRPNGTMCTGGVCNGGSCVPCDSGGTCMTTGHECWIEQTVCSSGSPVCTRTGNQPGGTPCGAGGMCDGGGNCVLCSSGGACSSGNPCRYGGMIMCPGGSCAEMNEPSGWPCGSGLTCDGFGNCRASGSDAGPVTSDDGPTVPVGDF